MHIYPEDGSRKMFKNRRYELVDLIELTATEVYNAKFTRRNFGGF